MKQETTLSLVSFLHQIPFHSFQPGFLKEHIPIQLDDQLNIQVKVRFGRADGARRMDVNVMSVFDEVIVDVVEE